MPLEMRNRNSAVLKMTPEAAVSRILCPVRGSGHSSGTGVAAGLEQPTRCDFPRLAKGKKDGQSLRGSLFGLAPGGGCRAATVTRRSGGLLPRHFTLTNSVAAVGGLVFCGPFPEVAPGRR